MSTTDDGDLMVSSSPNHIPLQTHHTGTTDRRRKNGYIEDDSPGLYPSPQSQYHLRYNNMKPDYISGAYKRVPERLFPDPSKFGWEFTGSSEEEKVEFYERQSEHGPILLNFYVTSGSIKVVLIRQEEGEIMPIQLFKKGRSLLPDIYKNVLVDPIMNTDSKYRRKGTQKMFV